ncbi:hypothetical protein EMCRGX_G001110 [Ephydatia muelleri]
MEIMDGKRSRMVHINRLHHHVQPGTAATPEVATGSRETWYPPQVEHFIVDIPTPMVTPQPPLPNAAQPLLEQPPLVGEEESSDNCTHQVEPFIADSLPTEPLVAPQPTLTDARDQCKIWELGYMV